MLGDAVDVEVRNLLARWHPRRGAPSCRAGCDRCCYQAVTATSGAVWRILDHPALTARADVIADHVRRLDEALVTQPDGPRAVGSLGPCPFLEAARCTLYADRPIPCRTLHVWHSPDRCGRDDVDPEVPPELDALRDHALLDELEAELDGGRSPFWGHLPLVVTALLDHREAYAAGESVVTSIPLTWVSSGLLMACTSTDELHRARADLLPR